MPTDFSTRAAERASADLARRAEDERRRKEVERHAAEREREREREAARTAALAEFRELLHSEGVADAATRERLAQSVGDRISVRTMGAGPVVHTRTPAGGLLQGRPGLAALARLVAREHEHAATVGDPMADLRARLAAHNVPGDEAEAAIARVRLTRGADGVDRGSFNGVEMVGEHAIPWLVRQVQREVAKAREDAAAAARAEDLRTSGRFRDLL